MRLITFLLLIFINFSFAKTIPYFKLVDENKKIVERNNLKGKPSILIFWSINCMSCKKELPVFNRYFKKYQNKINFFAIVIDSNDINEVKAIKKCWKFNIPVLLDGKKIMYKYNIFGVPISYFVDKNLKVKKILIGRASKEKIKKEIENLLK
ncbi:MAG: TlpA family protein disulfide reductase [Aquificota bacterium]|nr:MAG: TlpA family protein disulfide reductase [Aquificota bacterium]